MKYTKKQLRSMIKVYFTQVADGMPWEQPEAGEIDRLVKGCRFSFVENYTWSGTHPGVDMIFLLNANPKNYQAFTIEDGKLIELHQEHAPEYCLACLSKEQQLAEQETASSQLF